MLVDRRQELVARCITQSQFVVHRFTGAHHGPGSSMASKDISRLSSRVVGDLSR